MLFTKTHVLYLSRKKAVLAEVSVNPERVTELSTWQWQPDTLTEQLQGLLSQTKITSLMVLLANEVVHVADLEYPPDTTEQHLRENLQKTLEQELPEKITPESWDFKIVTVKKEQRARVMVPVMSVYESINQAAESLGITIEAIEPEMLAQERHQNPFIGIARKKDLSGKDQRTLNISIQPTDPEGGFSVMKKAKLILVLIGGVVLLLVMSFLWLNRESETPEPQSPVVTDTVFSPEPTSSPSPSPSPEPIKLDQYSLQVLNGSGVSGAAGTVADSLTAAGAEEVATGNADRTTYTDTVVQFKPELSTQERQQLIELFNEEVTTYRFTEAEESLNEAAEYDIIIILGDQL